MDKKPTPRPSVGMHWKCCNVYTRVYLNKDETFFAGNCPRCGRAARIRATHSQSGNKSRFWTAD